VGEIKQSVCPEKYIFKFFHLILRYLGKCGVHLKLSDKGITEELKNPDIPQSHERNSMCWPEEQRNQNYNRRKVR
jgi:hypothetical protein